MAEMVYELPEIGLEEIDKVYRGKPHKCMCGCAGDYFYMQSNAEAGGKSRGYELQAEEISDGTVKRILNKVKKNQGEGIEVIDDYIFTVVIGTKQYTIYKKGGE